MLYISIYIYIYIAKYRGVIYDKVHVNAF